MQEKDYTTPLIWSKLHRLQASGDLIKRSHLLDRLEEHRHRPLTLVSAPAGYGNRSWWTNGWIRPPVAVLAIVATVSFVLLAFSYWGLIIPMAWFRVIAAVSVTVSMLLLAVTWNNQFIFAVFIDAVILFRAFRWAPK
jgi:hypothetical protein